MGGHLKNRFSEHILGDWPHRQIILAKRRASRWSPLLLATNVSQNDPSFVPINQNVFQAVALAPVRRRSWKV